MDNFVHISLYSGFTYGYISYHRNFEQAYHKDQLLVNSVFREYIKYQVSTNFLELIFLYYKRVKGSREYRNVLDFHKFTCSVA